MFPHKRIINYLKSSPLYKNVALQLNKYESSLPNNALWFLVEIGTAVLENNKKLKSKFTMTMTTTTTDNGIFEKKSSLDSSAQMN